MGGHYASPVALQALEGEGGFLRACRVVVQAAPEPAG